MLCSCRVGFSSRPLLSHHFRLSHALPAGAESELLTAGIEVCLQTTQIGLIGILLAVFDFGITYNLWTFGMPGDVSDGIRPGNAVRDSLTVKLTRYSGPD